MKKLSLIILLLSRLSLADSIFNISPGSDERNAAHFGMSFAINTFTYALNRKALRMTPLQAFIFSACITTAIGVTYKMMEPGTISYGELNHALLWNSIGIGVSGMTINLGGW